MAIEVDFSGAGRDSARWFDESLRAARTWRGFMADSDVAVKLVEDRKIDAGQAWLVIQAAKVLDG